MWWSGICDWGYAFVSRCTVWDLSYDGAFLEFGVIPRKDFLTKDRMQGIAWRFNLCVGVGRTHHDIVNRRWRWKFYWKLITVPAWMDEPTVLREVKRESVAALVNRASYLPPMTAEEKAEQRLNWVWGEMRMRNPKLTREQFNVLVQEENQKTTPTGSSL